MGGETRMTEIYCPTCGSPCIEVRTYKKGFIKELIMVTYEPLPSHDLKKLREMLEELNSKRNFSYPYKIITCDFDQLMKIIQEVLNKQEGKHPNLMCTHGKGECSECVFVDLKKEE